jgi:hypothetical protein
VIAQQPRTTLPRPLQAEQDFISFKTLDELLEACRALVENPDFQIETARAGHRYYEAEIKPARRAMTILETACSDTRDNHRARVQTRAESTARTL